MELPDTSPSPPPAAPTAEATDGTSPTPQVDPSDAIRPSLPPPPAAADQAPSRVPMQRLAQGEKPPQFVIFSFDGGGWHDRWQSFMAAAAPTDARFTAFLTGIYLLTDAQRAQYTGPGHRAGRASVGFGGSPETVITLINDMNQAYAAGHEIGTHYNGHFCDGSPPSGKDWTAAQWTEEIDQFLRFFADWDGINDITDGPALNVPVTAIKGGRTPCLEGQWDQLETAWVAAGFTYDTSIPGSGMAWPKREYGVWEFRLPVVKSPTLGTVLAMDYNFWIKFNKGRNEPERATELHDAVLSTYWHMYRTALETNRAPVLIANHFNQWNGNAFNPAAAEFMAEVCGMDDTYCVTYSEVIEWMELQDPVFLEELQARTPVQ